MLKHPALSQRKEHKMIKKISLALLLSGCVSWVIAGEPPQRLLSGVGASLSVSTTPTVFVLEQPPNDNVISNGTFANTTAWTTNVNWLIDSGVATFTTNDTGTTNGTMYQTIIPCTSNETYRLVYTATITGPVKIFPQLGTAIGTTQTTSGTYTEELYLNTTNRLSFSAVATDGATCVVDNVSMRIIPDEAYACNVELSVLPTDVPVYVSYNCDGNTFTNIYAASRALIVTSNSVVTIDRGDKEGAIGPRRFWYRTGTGTATLTVNAN